jgi:ribosomal protein S12 methylthiotransferase accessory factor
MQESTRLDLRTIDSGVVLGLLEQFDAARISVTVWDVTSDVGIAAFRAVIFDDTADTLSRPFPAAFGAGCHPDRVVAIARALTEAAQSRLTVISGSRDDFGRARYAETQSMKALHYNRKLVRAGNGARSFAAAPHWCATSLDEEVDYVAARLAAVGLHQILYVALGEPALPVAAARVIVPGLEGPTEAVHYYPGARVRRRLGMMIA